MVQHKAPQYWAEVQSCMQTSDNSDVDPLVEMTLDDPANTKPWVQHTSQFINEVNPRFGETFDFVNISATSALNFVVWDKLNFFEGRFSIKGLTGAPLMYRHCCFQQNVQERTPKAGKKHLVNLKSFAMLKGKASTLQWAPRCSAETASTLSSLSCLGSSVDPPGKLSLSVRV